MQTLESILVEHELGIERRCRERNRMLGRAIELHTLKEARQVVQHSRRRKSPRMGANWGSGRAARGDLGYPPSPDPADERKAASEEPLDHVQEDPVPLVHGSAEDDREEVEYPDADDDPRKGPEREGEVGRQEYHRQGQESQEEGEDVVPLERVNTLEEPDLDRR